MSTKDMPEEVNEDAEVKPAAKKTVRKTIRRVRKVAPKRDKEETPAEPSSEDQPGEAATPSEAPEVAGAEKADADPAPPRKRTPKSNQRGSRGGDRDRQDSRQESASDDDQGRSEGRDRRGGERGERRGSGRQRRGANTPRRTLEPVNVKELGKKAWKIYQADIAEEGIALVDDKTGRNLALRSFDLARMFLEEEAKQKRMATAAKPESQEKSEAPERVPERASDDDGE